MEFPLRSLAMVLAVLMVVLAPVAAHPTDTGPADPPASSMAKYIPLPLETIPLRIRRIYKPKEKLPRSGEGLYLESVTEESELYRAGLRKSMVIREVNGRSVNTRRELSRQLSKSLGKETTLTVWDPTNADKTKLNFQYKLDRDDVVVHPDGELFHDPELSHSPDPDQHPSYSSSYRAKAHGYEPCPVCFPDDERSIWQEVIRRGIDVPSPYVQKLINNHGRVHPIPSTIKNIFEGLVEHRLRHRLRPSLILLNTRKLFGIASPSGVIVISEGLISFAETRRQKELILAHMLAHADRKHPPRSIRYQQATSILNEAIDRVADVAVGIDDLGDLLFNAFGFTFQRRWQGRGYDEPQEREAIFLSLYYLYKDGTPMEVISRWEIKRRDMTRNLHENWANYLVMHPNTVTPQQTREWMSNIRAEIVPEETSPFTPEKSTRARIELFRSGYQFTELSLNRAMVTGDTRAVKHFLDAGWNPNGTLPLNIAPKQGASSTRVHEIPLLHYAAALGDRSLVHLLLEAGARINGVYTGPLPKSNLRDVTPLFSALAPSLYETPKSLRKDSEVLYPPPDMPEPRAGFIRYLLRQGADPTHESRDGTTPRDWARSRDQTSLLPVLKEAE